MTYQLRPGLSFGFIGERAVLLDLDIDRYFLIKAEAAQALPAGHGSAKYWLTLLLGAPAIAASTAVLVAAISPLARRWRALPER